jgi:hypothetical protein
VTSADRAVASAEEAIANAKNTIAKSEAARRVATGRLAAAERALVKISRLKPTKKKTKR